MATEAARLGPCRPMAGRDWGGDWRGAGPVEGGARGRRRRRRRLQQRRRRPRQKRPGSRQVRSAGLRDGQGPRRSHLLAAEPVRPEAGVWLRTRGLRTGRGPGALSASSPPPQPPLGSALPPGGRPGASCGAGAPGLQRGGKCSGVCACSGDKSCVQDPTAGGLEGWRAGGAAAVGQVGRGPLAGGGRRCA